MKLTETLSISYSVLCTCSVFFKYLFIFFWNHFRFFYHPDERSLEIKSYDGNFMVIPYQSWLQFSECSETERTWKGSGRSISIPVFIKQVKLGCYASINESLVALPVPPFFVRRWYKTGAYFQKRERRSIFTLTSADSTVFRCAVASL